MYRMYRKYRSVCWLAGWPAGLGIGDWGQRASTPRRGPSIIHGQDHGAGGSGLCGDGGWRRGPGPSASASAHASAVRCQSVRCQCQ